MDQVDQPKRVVVCGGGVIGVCTAYFLSKKGAAVTLVERSSIACAASGKAGGFLALEMCDEEPIKELARASYNLHRLLAEELDGPQSYGYRPLTSLSLSINESEAPDGSGGSESSNLPAWIDGPAKNTETTGTTETTAQVHPQLFCRALMSRAVEAYGAKVVIGKVERVAEERGTVVVDLEGWEVIEADAVVLALGPWSSSLPLLSSLFRVSGFKAHSIVLEPKERDAITAHAVFLSYYSEQVGKLMNPEVYPRPTGEVYICGMQSEIEGEIPEDPEEIKPVPESIKVLKTVAKNVSKHMGEGEAKVKAEQACFLPYTDDRLPVIGKLPGLNNCYVATGHSCWGILNGPASGAALAELLLDGLATIVDLTPFSPDRFVSNH